MEFEKIEKLIKSMEADLKELRFANPDSSLLKDKIKRALIDLYEEVQSIEVSEEKSTEAELSTEPELSPESELSPEPELSNMYIAQPEVVEQEPIKDPEIEKEPEAIKEVAVEPVQETVRVETNQVQMSMTMEEGVSGFPVQDEIEDEVEEVVEIENNQFDIEETEFEVPTTHEVEFESMSIIQKHRVEQNDVLEGFKKKPIENGLYEGDITHLRQQLR